MTILAAARGRDTIVIGADSQETVEGGLRRSTQKLIRPQAGLIAAWAGYKDVAQAMELSLSEEPLDLEAPRSKVAEAAKERFRSVRADPDVEHRTDFNAFMLGWYCRAERKPVALRLMTHSATWVERWEYIGTKSAVATGQTAERLISYVDVAKLDADQLSVVAFKVLRDCIAIAPVDANVGGDVQLATVTAAGVHILDADELRAASDTLDLWEERSAELLTGAPVPQDVDQPDRGLRPPS